MQVSGCLVLLVLAAICTSATEVKQCDGGEVYEDAGVEISDCDTPPCRLKRKSTVNCTMILTPENDVESLKNSVQGIVVGVPLPFLGVDGTDACPNIYDAEGNEQVGCPLKAGTTYMYKNVINVLEIYPKLKVSVQWGVIDESTTNFVKCFKVMTQIV